MRRDVIDAEFEVVSEPEGRLRPALSVAAIFWFCVYAGGAAWAVAETEEPIARAGITFAAALLVPLWRLFSSVAQKVSEPEAQRLRKRLLGQE